MKSNHHHSKMPRFTSHRYLLMTLALSLVVTGCANRTSKTEPEDAIRSEMQQVAAPKPAAIVPPQISDALQNAEAAAQVATSPAEPRFDLIVNNALAREVFLAMVWRYQILVTPSTHSGTVTA